MANMAMRSSLPGNLRLHGNPARCVVGDGTAQRCTAQRCKAAATAAAAGAVAWPASSSSPPLQRCWQHTTGAVQRGRSRCARAAAATDGERGAAPAVDAATTSTSSISNGSMSGNGNGNGSSSTVKQAPAIGTHLECVSTGMDVACRVEPDEPGMSTGGSSATTAATTNQQQQQSQSPFADGRLAPVLNAAFLVAPFFLWGTTMAAMRPVTAHATPLMMGAMRLLPGGAALVAWAAASGRPQPATAAAWLWVAAFALVDGAMFQGFLAEGLQRTSAGLGSVIIDSQPLTVAVLAALLFGEPLGGAAVAGLALGVLGLLLLEAPPEAAGALLAGGPGALGALAGAARGALEGGVWESGEWWMLLAAQSMAVGTVMVRGVMRHADPVMATGWHMVLGGAALLALSLSTDGPELAARLAGFGWPDAAAMAYGSLLGGAAAYGIFFYNASRGSLTALSSLTFLTPMFAAGAGYLALGETLTPLQLAGAGVTLSAVYLINARGDSSSGDNSSGDSSSSGKGAKQQQQQQSSSPPP